jgi:hypothetical protein
MLMEAASTSETQGYFYQTTRRNSLEDSHLNFNVRFVLQQKISFLQLSTVISSVAILNLLYCNGTSVRQVLSDK